VPTLSTHVIGELLALMGRQRINKSEMSRRLGESEVWVGRRLNGVVPLLLDDVARFATVLAVDVARLLPGSEGSPCNPRPVSRPIDGRPHGHPATRRPPSGPGRTSRVQRVIGA